MQFLFSADDPEYKFPYYTELVECVRDPAYFIEHYCMIDHPVQGQINFDLYKFQRDMISLMNDGTHCTAINAARQMGTTAISCGYVLWRLLFNQGEQILSIHPTGGFKEEFIQRVVNMYNALPSWMQTNIVVQTKSELRLDNGSRLVVDRVHVNVARGILVT